MRFALAAFLLVACGSSSNDTQPQRAPEPQIAVPEVAGNGYGTIKENQVSVVITKTSLRMDDALVVPLTDGKVAAGDLEGGAQGIKIVRLANATQNLLDHLKADNPPVFAIHVDPALTYKLLISTMFSIKQAKVKQFAIIARSGGKLVGLPITLPEKRPVSKSISDDEAFAIADKLTSPNGTDVGDMSSRRPGRDLGDQIADVKTQPPSGIKITKRNVTPSSTLTGDIAASKIASAYAAGLKRCASSKPGHHKVELVFGIDEDGRAGGPKLTGETGEIADCIGGLINGWRFPVARGPGGKAIGAAATIGIEFDVEQPKPDGSTANAQMLTGSGNDGKDDLAPRTPGPSLQDQVDQVMDLRMFVSISHGEIIVWSISQLEGSLKAPRARIRLGPKAAAELSAVLSEIVTRRFSKRRPPDSKTIVIQADGDTAMQVVAEVMGAVRAGPDGRELFPEIQLSTGFE